MTCEDIKQIEDMYIEEHMEELWQIAQYVHANPEICFQEEKAQQIQCEYLERYGFSVEQKVGGLSTAFSATFSTGEGLHLGIISEYDALPGIGHGCGHNLICTTALGTAIATKKYMEDADIQGTITVFGTPAEEDGGGKIKMLAAGVFEGVDAIIFMHPTSSLTRLAGACMSSKSIDLKFIGKPAHAGSHPENGINALSAANLYFVATGLMRQHCKGDMRLSGIISKGGESTGQIPALVEVKGSLSCFHLSDLELYQKRIEQCAKGAALAMDCEVELHIEDGYQGRVPNAVLADVCKKEFEILQEPLLEGLPDDFGGEDLGNVSRIIPICNPYTTIFPAYKISNHTEQFRELSNSLAGKRCIEISSKAMARTLYEYFQHPDIIVQAKEELAKRLRQEVLD